MLASLKEVINEGRRRKIAVGSFNTPNLESLVAVLSSAEELNVPVIIAHAQCHESVAPLDVIGKVMVELAKASSVKVCVHLDHGEDLDYLKRAIALGFTSVMIDYSVKSFEENVDGTRKVVEYAHARGVDVEAELGALPQREGGGSVSVCNSDLYTKPALVPEFLAKTGADALAIAFGTAHGISHEQYREVIRLGIDKINYYSYMAYAGYEEAKRTVEQIPADFFHNLALNAQNAMRKNVLETLKVFSGGKQ